MNTPHLDDRRLEKEMCAVRTRNIARRVALVVLIAALVTLAVNAVRHDRLGLVDLAFIAFFVTVLLIVPLLILWAILAALRDRNGNRICKRIHPERQVLGVCLGLAEATGTAVLVFRLGFIALTLADGIGLALYLFLALAMPVHPDDRRYMMRFRLSRMWQRRFAHADDDDG